MVSWPTNEWGHPGATRDDEAITGAAEAPVLTTVVEDRQLMPTLPQSGLSESQRLHAPEESIETVHGRLHNADGESALLYASAAIHIELVETLHDCGQRLHLDDSIDH